MTITYYDIPAGKAILKKPDDIKDYLLDWSDELSPDSDEIDTSVFTVPSGITKNSDSDTPSTATVWLSGGSDGEDYLIENKITTTGGRTITRCFTVQVRAC